MNQQLKNKYSNFQNIMLLFNFFGKNNQLNLFKLK